MKKLLLLPLLLFTLTGCGFDKIATYDEPQVEEGMITLCKHYVEGPGRWAYFIRDTYTDNIYVFAYEGSPVPYYNKDGAIMKYSEFQRVHKHN